MPLAVPRPAVPVVEPGLHHRLQDVHGQADGWAAVRIDIRANPAEVSHSHTRIRIYIRTLYPFYYIVASLPLWLVKMAQNL